MAEKLAIHIPPDANPTNVTELIRHLYEVNTEFATISEIIELARQNDIGSRTEMTLMASLMGFFDRSDGKIRLSAQGHTFATLEPEIQGEILHWLLYSGWRQSDPLNFLPSWSYRKICDRLWDLGTQQLDSAFLDKLVTEIIGQTESEFQSNEAREYAGVSFSRKSLTGAFKWLSVLHPPVLENNTFQRRDFCEPPIMLLAFNYALRDDPDALDVNILLSDELREQICRVCLLDPAYFDQTLDWMLPLYPAIISSDPDVGYYGRYVRLKKLPTIEDLLP